MAQYYSQEAYPVHTFQSRGLYPSGGPMSDGTRRVLQDHGIRAQGHRSQQLTQKDLIWADVIVPMTEEIGHYLRTLEPSKVFEFWNYQGEEVPDPYGGSLETYERTYEVLKENIKKMMAVLEGKR